MAKIAVVGDIVIAKASVAEKTENGYRITSSNEGLIGGAGAVANDLFRRGNKTFTAGVVGSIDLVYLRRRCLGDFYFLGSNTLTPSQEFINLDMRIDRGSRPQINPIDARQIASKIQQWGPDEIRVIDCDDLILQAICDLGMGNLIYREQPVRTAE